MDSICLKYENLCKDNFEYLLNYCFKNYIKELNKNEEFEFSDIIKDLLSEIVNINNLGKNIDDYSTTKELEINADEFETIKNIIKNLSDKAANARIKFYFDLEDEENKKYIKIMYKFFKEKLIKINNSKEKRMLCEYFSKEKTISNNLEIFNLINYQNDEKSQFKKRMLHFFNVSFKKLFNKNVEFIEKYIYKANKLIKIIFEEEKIRISILGCYNAGKSSIINSFIGDDLLPVDEDECTRIIICIRYYNSNEPILYKANLDKDNCNFTRYCLNEDRTTFIIKGKNIIKEQLTAINLKKKRKKIWFFFCLCLINQN